MVPDTASRLPLIETNKPKQKNKTEVEFVLQICNHQIKSTPRTERPLKSDTSAAFLGDWWTPGSVRSPRSSTQFVKEENFVFFKVDLGLFKKKKKEIKHE